MVFETPAFSLKARASGVAAPSFTPGGGTYNTAQSVTITCATEGAKIYYRTDGNSPLDSVNDLVEGSIEYNAPIEVAADMIIKASQTVTVAPHPIFSETAPNA